MAPVGPLCLPVPLLTWRPSSRGCFSELVSCTLSAGRVLAPLVPLTDRDINMQTTGCRHFSLPGLTQTVALAVPGRTFLVHTLIALLIHTPYRHVMHSLICPYQLEKPQAVKFFVVIKSAREQTSAECCL